MKKNEIEKIIWKILINSSRKNIYSLHEIEKKYWIDKRTFKKYIWKGYSTTSVKNKMWYNRKKKILKNDIKKIINKIDIENVEYVYFTCLYLLDKKKKINDNNWDSNNSKCDLD